MPDLEKIVIVSPSMVKAVPKEVESTTCMAAAEQSGSVAMGLVKRNLYDKTITETHKAKITPGMPWKMALQQPCVILRQSNP